MQPAGQVEDRRALDHRVVDVEERRRGRVRPGSQEDSTSAARRRRLPGEAESARGRSRRGRDFRVVSWARRRQPRWPLRRGARPVWKTRDVTANVADSCSSGGRVARRGRPSSTPHGAEAHLGGARRAGRPRRGWPAEQGLVGRPPGVIAPANRSSSPSAPRRAPGPTWSPSRSTPVRHRASSYGWSRTAAPACRRGLHDDLLRPRGRAGCTRRSRAPTTEAAPGLRPRSSAWTAPSRRVRCASTRCWRPHPDVLPDARDPEALAVLLYTSGTSGRPRAAMLSHRALLANLEQAAAVDPPMLTSDDVVYGVLPLFHVYGLNAVLGQVLRQQACLVVADGFDPEGSLDDIVTHGVTVVPVAPPVLAAWRCVDRLRERLAGVRVLMSGSAPLSSELRHRDDRRRPAHRPPGLRTHRGRAGRDLHPRAARRPSRVGRRAPPRGASSGWSTTRAPSRSPATPGRSSSRGTTCSTATGPTAPTARSTGGWPRATSGTWTPTGTCSWSTASRSWSSSPASTSTPPRSRTRCATWTGSSRPP